MPIVFVLNNPVEIGLVPSLGRPGGNITGLAAHSPEISGKRLELLTAHRAQLVELVDMSRLPTVYALREMMEVGGLMSYGAGLPDLYRRVATHVDKILKGAQCARHHRTAVAACAG